MTKTLQNLNEADLKAMAEALFANNTWFHRNGEMVTVADIERELLAAAWDRAEHVDAHNAPCKVGE